MKKKMLKVLSVMLVVVIMLTAAPLSGFVGLELPEWLDFSIGAEAATMSEGSFKIVLKWGSSPRDLDSHVSGTLPNGSSFHCYYGNKNIYYNGKLVVNLDTDDTSSYGPETITIDSSIIASGNFTYYIYNYTGTGSIPASGANVTLYKGDDLIDTFSASGSSSGRYWTMFKFVKGGVSVVDDIGSSVSSADGTPISGKNFTQYSFKFVDKVSNKPVTGCTLSVNNEIYNISDDGIFTLFVENISDYYGEKIIISSTGYESYSCYLTDFNMYEQNIVRLTGSLGAGIHIVNTAFGTETINGPTMEVLGKEITLFTVDIGLDFSNLAGLESLKHLDSYLDDVDSAIKGSNIMIEESTKTIKVMLGVSDGYDVTNTGKWNEDYKDFKDYYKSFSSISGQERLNKYRKIRSKLKQSKNDMVFSADTTFCGYAEISYATGELVIKEGGIVATAEAGVSETVPIGTWFYATFELKGEIEGKLLFQKNEDSTYSMGTNMSLAVKPSLEAGAKLFSKKLASAGIGIDGEINGLVELPAGSLSDALTITLSAQAYIRLNLLFLEAKPKTNFPSLQLYPKVEFMTNFESHPSLIVDESAFQPVDRSYLLNCTMMNFYNSVTGGKVTSFREYDVYPYMSPKLVTMDDGSVIAIWIKDDGSKSDNNRTTLYYRVYKDGAWSEEQAVFETEVADFAPVIYKENEKVHIIWQRATEVFSDEVTMDDSLDKTELVYSCYENGTFTEPVTIVNNNKYLMNYTVVAENDNVFVSWVENSENDYTLTAGTTSICSRQLINGEWQTTVTEKESVIDLSEVVSCYIDSVPTVAYTTYTDGETSQCNLYVGDVEYSDAMYYGISYHNDKLYTLVNGELSYYDGGVFTGTGLQNVGIDYELINDGTSEAVIYSVDNGFKNELYITNLIDNQYTTPVALTEYDSHVSCFDADYYNGQVVLIAGVDNLDNNTDDFPYGTTDLIFESFGETTDASISEAVYYDEDSIIAGGTTTFTTFITNQGTSTINGATLSLSDLQGVVNSVEITEAILPGETREVEIEFAIPDDYECSVLSFEISTDNDCESTNNNAEITIGKADIVLTDYAVNNGKIIGKVSNLGFEDADDVKIQIDNFETEYTSLSTISVGTIASGETKEFEYELSAEYTSYINYTDYDEFDLGISTSTPEANYENNHCSIIGAPIRVESITLNYSEVDVCLENTVALIATVEPVNAMNRNVIWISDSTDIAAVDENGVVTTYARGTAIISAITEDGDIVASCTVNVYSDFEFEKIKNNTEIKITGYIGSENNLVIPDTLEGLPVTAIDAEFTDCTFETVYLGSNITEITSSSFNDVNTLKEITVDTANTTYLSDNGVLFNIDGTTMLKYPQGKLDTDYLVPEDVTSIGANAIVNVANLENITVPYYVSNISSGSFEGCLNINVNCYENSPAHNYCVENSIPYTLIVHDVSEHEYSITTYVNPTCVSVGYTKHTCWICGDSYTDTEIEATGHNYESVVTAPTCTEDGYTTYTCSACSDTYVADETSALGHTEADAITENLIEETCVEDGSYDTVIYCSICSEELERTTVVIPSLGGHTEGDWEISTEATCISTGEKVRKCTNCSTVLETEEISATGVHNISDWIVTVEVTCLSDGEKVKKCSVCEELFETETIGATGHNYEAVVTEPSCFEGGYTTYTCSYCADTYISDETEAIGEHNVVDGVCERCGEIIQSITYELKWDKDEYLPGETAHLSVYMNVADSLSLGTGSLTIGFDSNTILQDDNLADDIEATITTSELFDSFWKAPPSMAWQSATIVNKILNLNTQEENEKYDQYLKILFARNTSGSHENASNSKNGVYGYEFNSEEPIMTLSFVVASDVDSGVNLNSAITSGSILGSPLTTYFKYYVDPGNATTTKNLDGTTIDISQACATASISDGTSECIHENTTETENIILLPTCVTDGEKTISIICDDCGEAVSVTNATIPATGHNFNAVVTVPTCISQGYTTYTCSCGECYISDYVDSIEHCYDNGICMNCGGYRPCVFVENGMYVEGLYYNLNTLDWVKNNVGIDNISIEIYSINDEKLSNDDLVGTGATVYIYDSSMNELLDTYTVVLYGDVNGDGLINSADQEIITSVATCQTTIENEWCLMAADTNHDGAVDSFDVIETQLQTLDMHNIEQINNSAYIKNDEENENVA